MPLGAARAIVYGTIAVGVFDGLDAIVFFGLRGVKPFRIFQAIASGLLGRASFSGGYTTTALGVALHFFIAFGIVTVYYFTAGRIAVLTQHPVIYGLLYGIAVYFFMNYVVLPLSAVDKRPFLLPVFVNGIAIHMLGVGLPSALFARWGRG